MFWMLLLIPSLVLHEWAHAWAADLLGDSLPRRQGRLTLNPLRHMHPIGTLLLPAATLLITQGSICLAFAKPVYFEPDAFQNPRRDTGFVALAGPVSNIFAGIAAALLWRFTTGPHWLVEGLCWFSVLNLAIAALNLLPLPPLDGSKVLAALMPDRYALAYLDRGVWAFFAFAVVALVSPSVTHFDLIQGYFDLTVGPVFRAAGGA